MTKRGPVGLRTGPKGMVDARIKYLATQGDLEALAVMRRHQVRQGQFEAAVVPGLVIPKRRDTYILGAGGGLGAGSGFVGFGFGDGSGSGYGSGYGDGYGYGDGDGDGYGDGDGDGDGYGDGDGSGDGYGSG